MTIPSSGSLAISAIQTEFGGSNPISMSEYYAGGANTPAGTTGNNGTIPSSGALDFNDFRGSTKASFMTATGGSITTTGNFKVHSFTGSSTFTVTNAGVGYSFSSKVRAYVVAGGGGTYSDSV